MIPSLKKINTEILRKQLIRTSKGHILNTCPLKLDTCMHQEEINKSKTSKDEIDICSHCWIDWLIKESEV